MLLLPVALIGAWIFLPAVMTEAQQGAPVGAKATREVPSSATQEPAKAGVPASPAATVPVAKNEEKAGAAQQPANQTKNKKNSDEQSEDNPPPFTPAAVGIAAAMIAVLGLLFWLQLNYSHRLEQTTYLGTIYRGSVSDYEYTRLTAKHIDLWSKRQYHLNAIKDLPPEQIPEDLKELDFKLTDGSLASWRADIIDRLTTEGPGADYWAADGGGTRNPYGSSTGNLLLPGLSRRPGGYEPPTENEDAKARAERQRLFEEYRPKREEFEQRFKEWAQKIWQTADEKYKEDKAEDRREADKLAGKAIDSTEASLLKGQGPQFVLEFTAIIVIIFSAVILGVLDRLGRDQIGTLLAAIAGYVLGKATTARGGTSEAKQQ
jgi:hypothetical protein